MRLIYIVLCLFFSLSIYGQSDIKSSQDNALKQEWVDEANFYAVLFTGKEQIKYPFSYENHPFYIQKEPINGFLTYDGVDYPLVGLRWDTYRDDMIAISSDQRFNVILVPERFSEAGFQDNHLFFIDANKASGIPKSGYFLNLYDNKYKVWAKPFALLNNKHVEQRAVNYFTFHKHYYIQKGETYYAVKNLSGIYRVFADKKKELKQYVKKNNLNFRASPDNIIPLIVREYERLTQTDKQ